jgi:hypothetical protein
MGELVRAPGIDERTWIAKARVDEDEDAIRFAGAEDQEDGPLGWIVDVTFVDGPLANEGPIPCRLSSVFAGPSVFRADPVRGGCLVLVAITEGNINTDPIIVGVLSADDCPAPATVNGTDIDEAYALGTHILVTDLAVDEQVAGDRRVKTGDGATHRLLGESLELADEGATQPYVRGDSYADSEATFLDALEDLVVAINTAVGLASATAAGGVVIAPPDLLAFTEAVSTFKSSRSGYLSTRIKGE